VEDPRSTQPRSENTVIKAKRKLRTELLKFDENFILTKMLQILKKFVIEKFSGKNVL
jgi:hypothetical protein